jgi:hypothetical protein
VLHTSLLTLVSLPGTTLLDLHRLLSAPALRQRLVRIGSILYSGIVESTRRSSAGRSGLVRMP